MPRRPRLSGRSTRRSRSTRSRSSRTKNRSKKVLAKRSFKLRSKRSAARRKRTYRGVTVDRIRPNPSNPKLKFWSLGEHTFFTDEGKTTKLTGVVITGFDEGSQSFTLGQMEVRHLLYEAVDKEITWIQDGEPVTAIFKRAHFSQGDSTDEPTITIKDKGNVIKVVNVTKENVHFTRDERNQLRIEVDGQLY